jgi:hypothetical protein
MIVRQLNALLTLYKLISTVTFPTRFGKDSIFAIDNIFIDGSKFDNCKIFPVINVVPNHDAQLITINIQSNQPQDHQIYFKRKINKYTIADFQIKLSYETWDSNFECDDVNNIFNSFLNTYLRIFYSSFPLTKVKKKTTNTSWITLGIKISCKRTRELYIVSKNSNNSSIKIYYRNCCKVFRALDGSAHSLYFQRGSPTSTAVWILQATERPACTQPAAITSSITSISTGNLFTP